MSSETNEPNITLFHYFFTVLFLSALVVIGILYLNKKYIKEEVQPQPPSYAYYNETVIEYSFINSTSDTACINIAEGGYLNGDIELKQGDLSYWRSNLPEKGDLNSGKVPLGSFVKSYRILSSVRKQVEIK